MQSTYYIGISACARHICKRTGVGEERLGRDVLTMCILFSLSLSLCGTDFMLLFLFLIGMKSRKQIKNKCVDLLPGSGV